MRIALTLDRDATRRKTNDYLRALLHAGFQREEIEVVEPGTIPAGEFDGIVLGGGCDVDPARYGQPIRPDARVELDAGRDTTDFALFDRAWRDSIPVLGICRGLQVINVALGGTLIQDIPSERPSEIVHDHTAEEKTRRDHAVRVSAGSRLAAVADAGELPVNSRHHQAVANPAKGLLVSAVSSDGLIEALETESDHGRWLLAVQWHPENLSGDPPSERLFSEFARAVRQRTSALAGTREASSG
jgi:putative glutamine amidotransferase